MSQMQYYPDFIIQPTVLFSSTNSGTTLTGTEFEVVINKEFKEDKPVEIVNDKIEVTEALIDEGKIYPVFYKNENFYVRRKNRAIEIFQIQE
jgi:hypothetical protein